MRDVLLLAEVFDNFRTNCITYYYMDRANYVTPSSFAWEAMLLKITIKLDVLHNLNMLNMMEKMNRGGLCSVGSKRYVKANSKHVPNYDKNKNNPRTTSFTKTPIISVVVTCLNIYLTKI